MNPPGVDPFWRREGAAKTFTHPLPAEWLTGIGRGAGVLDFGCGYGRLTPALRAAGFRTIDGYDPSPELTARAACENPGGNYTSHLGSLQDRCYGLVLCLAVFNCIPRQDCQEDTVRFIDAVTRPGSCLVLSDYLMEDNPHYDGRYTGAHSGTIGCFTSGRATFRHHQRGHFERLFSAWSKEQERPVQGRTMNGTSVTMRQWFFRKTEAARTE